MNTDLTPAVEQATGLQQAAMQQLKSGAGWFYLIFGLSVVNSLVILFGGNFYFVVGLGVNHLVTAIIYSLAGMEEYASFGDAEIGLRIVVLIVSTIIASPFLIFGIFANKRNSWAFITGMVLYAVDAIIFLILGDFMSVGFHALALFFIFKGYSALQNLNKLEMEARIAKAGLAQPIK